MEVQADMPALTHVRLLTDRATLSDGNWTNTILDGDPVYQVLSFTIINLDTGKDLYFRSGTTEDGILIPYNSDGTASFVVDFDGDRYLVANATNKIMVKAGTGAQNYEIIAQVVAS